MNPKTKISNLPGVGSFYSYKLGRLDIETLEDLIYHFPFRYDDFSKVEKIKDVKSGDVISIIGSVWQIKNIRTRSGKFITTATVADESSTCEVIWFNQPYLTKTIKPGTPISLSGKAQIEGVKLKLLSPSYEILQTPQRSQALSDNIHTGTLVPVYPETEGVTSKWLRSKIKAHIENYIKQTEDFIPKDILKNQGLSNIQSALTKIHFPKNYKEVDSAQKRLSFDEIFQIQLISQIRKRDWQKNKKSQKIKIERKKVEELIKSLPFKLTNSQSRATEEILSDLRKEIPANRLLEGDVGSGKTIVAAIAAYCVLVNDLEVLLAAPTEILAFQHQKTLEEVLSPFGIKVGIWTGSKKESAQITCGTHALLSTFKPKKQVGMVIVDEQHRFGVAQRAKLFLGEGKKLTPHLLTMTATPIPRTLALTLHGDLDLSVLSEMPKGRLKISTFVVPNFKRSDAYKFVEKEIKKGRQAFILTPFVEPSETMTSVKSAVIEFEKLKKTFSKKIKLGLLHGRLKSKEKQAIIEKFKNKKIDILVTTPVVEVGIDIPNASVMLIESAERFGLAQLHQLRGRVGRGEHKSYCLLFTDSKSEQSQKRLKSMEKIYVGFELAEIDLKMRGPGEVFGLKQSGFTTLKLADIMDSKLLSSAQQEAKELLKKDKDLKKHSLLKEKLEKFQKDLVEPN